VNILVLNCGSSSQGFKLYLARDDGTLETIVSGKARNVATKTRAGAFVDWSGETGTGKRELELSSHALATEAIISILDENGLCVDAVGHRFVHGGARFTSTTLIDAASLPGLKDTARLAPIHNPNTLSVIEVCLRRFGDIPEFAVFDTMFYAGLPEAAYTYALPSELSEQFNFRKFGFHGLSYQYVSRRTAELLGRPLEQLAMVIAHLGTGGSSVVAVKAGQARDTSIGSTMSGLVMSTRSGDIAPEIELELMRAGYGADEIEDLLANRSGLVGLARVSSNLVEVIAAAEEGDRDCKLAVDVYSHRLSHYLGAYFWLLGGADAIVFTDDAGTKAWQVRKAVCESAKALGVVLDPAANEGAVGVEARISAPESATAVFVVPTDEELVIAQEVLEHL
jgi:acetate kinase